MQGDVTGMGVIPDGCSCAFWQARNRRWATLGERPEAATLGWWCPEHGIARVADDGPVVHEASWPVTGRRAPREHVRVVRQVRARHLQAALFDGGQAP